MSIFVTGDVHGIAEYGASRFSSRSWPLGCTLTRDDVVIVAGDFGFIWGGSNTDKYWLDWFESKPWTTCFVDGNHENHRLLAELPVREWNGGLVHEVRPHVLHLMRGEVFDIAGTTVLTMGGAASHDKQWRQEGKTWWPEEMPSESETEHCLDTLDRVGWKVDYVVTHEAPSIWRTSCVWSATVSSTMTRCRTFWASSTIGLAIAPGSLVTTMTMNGAMTSIVLSTRILCRSKRGAPMSRVSGERLF